MKSQVNGIDMQALHETVKALREDPELGKCHFRARNKWINANRNVGRVHDYYAAKQEMTHQTTFETYADEPPILAGEDTAANPVEHLLTALVACLTTAMVAHAAVRGIEIEELESEIEGDIDLNGYMGLSSSTPRGYQNIRVGFKVKSDAPSDELRRLAEFSPVFNTIAEGANVELNVEASPTAEEAVAGGAGEERPSAPPA